MAKESRSAVWLEGSFFIWHSLANVNRQLATHLAKRLPKLRIRPYDKDAKQACEYPYGEALQRIVAKSGRPALTIRHSFPPNLGPHEGSLAVMQPWEFLAAPASWVDFFKSAADEVWVNSNFTRNVYIRSGVPAEKVVCLPLGYEPELFHPGATPFPLDGGKSEFRFLYTGGTIERKGIDVLLTAYLAEFTPSESVRLVIKDTGTRHVYRNNNHQERILAIQADSRAPKVNYLDQDLQPEKLAGVYTACNCLVQPYRGEGFCLPVLEAMASGLPVIVTNGGATDDLVLHMTGWKVASRPVEIEQLAGLEASGPQGWLEPDVSDLRKTMRQAFEDREGRTKAFGENAAKLASQNWTWEKVAPLYEARVRDLLSRKPARPTKRARAATTARVSLCMIVRDEEQVLAECLESAKPHFDEIVVVDTGSIDKTKEIAGKYADRIVDFRWVDDFSAARNESLKHATGDWIFWMDADDTLPKETGEAIRRAAESAPDDVVAFIVPVRFVDDGSAAGGTQVDHVKLFRNFPGLSFEGRIHEQVLPSLREAGGRIARLDALVLHTNYDNSEEGQRRKHERDRALLDLDLKERPGHPFVLFNIGMTHHYCDEHEAAVRRLRESIEAAGPNDSHIRKAYALIVGSQRKLGKIDEAMATCEEALAEFPDDPELLFNCAVLFTEKRRLYDAAQAYRKVLESDPAGYFSSFDHGILGYKTHHNLAGVYAQMKDYEKAKHWWLRAIEEAPSFSASAFDLFANSVEVGDRKTAKSMIEHVQDQRLGYSEWVGMVAAWLRKFESDSDALGFLESRLESNADDDDARIHLARILLDRGDVAAAMPHLKRLDKKGSSEAAHCLGVAAFNREELKEARRHLRRAAKRNPGHPQTQKLLQTVEERLETE